MAKVKIVGNNLDQNLNRESFNNTASQTIFSFGAFSMTSNFDGRTFIDYTGALTSFVKPITLETLELTDTQSEIIENKSTNVVLNLDKSDFKSFVRFGSAYEFLRTSIEDIILKYPSSLFFDSNALRGGNDTFRELEHNMINDVTVFKVPINSMINEYGMLFRENDAGIDVDNIRNVVTSYQKYVVWVETGTGINIKKEILGFTGTTNNTDYLILQTNGNPFEEFIGDQTFGSVNFHIRPNSEVFEEFRQQLNDFQQYILSNRLADNEGFEFMMRDPQLMNDGSINYVENVLVWTTSDGYNLDFNNVDYRRFFETLLNIGSKYDRIKTDLIARFLSPTSIKTYDLTEEGKITKLLRVYGREFDQMRGFIDSLAYVNRTTYDKINNVPDQIVKNLAKTMGWDYFSLVNEAELVNSLFSLDDQERNLTTDLLPVEIDIELWRRIIINTTYFWKSKGTRAAMKSILLMVGIPEPFVEITEHVYTVDGRIDPRQMELQPIEFGSDTYPFDEDGYPQAPPETTDFYFQLSGNTDSGQAYMDNFRKAGFVLRRTVDNKKTWIREGSVVRRHELTPSYFQLDSKLVLNTKEVNVALDVSRAIEYDLFNYIKKDYIANSTGYTLPYSYVNISVPYSGTENTFNLPNPYTNSKDVKGDLEVRFNGILLNGANKFDGTEIITDLSEADYVVNPDNTFTLLTGFAESSANKRDVIQATFVYSGGTTPITGVSVQYIVTRLNVNPNSSTITLPTKPNGHVQLTINGISLTRGTSQFIADYIVNPNNETEIVIQNNDVISYINAHQEQNKTAYLQVAYLEVSGSSSIEARNEIHRVDSFNSSKLYFNSQANRFVYVLNYRMKSVHDVKVLVNGIALEPASDYFLNANNAFEIFLPRNIKLGSVVSIYYLIGGDDFLNPILQDVFCLGEFSTLSFLEFIDLIERKLINARTRKTVTDFKGGWYPTLLRLYIEYLKRSGLDDDDTLQSNGYTFQNLFPFISKYNSFFEKFVTQLLSATIINRKSGILIRNTIFTKQKFTYKRGVLFSYDSDFRADGSPRGQGDDGVGINVVPNTDVKYLGYDGSMFLVPQEASVITPSLETIEHDGVTTTRINNVGGKNIVMFNSVTRFGMQYRKVGDEDWNYYPENLYDKSFWGGGGLVPATPQVLSNSFRNINIPDLDSDTQYEYRAVIRIGDDEYYGNIFTATTNEVIIPEPSVQTRVGNATTNQNNVSTISTGGDSIVRVEDVDYYGMFFRKVGDSSFTPSPAPPFNATTNPITGNQFNRNITGLEPSTQYEYYAFIIISGVTYTGEVLTITTPAISQTIPVVTTGIVGKGGVQTTEFTVSQNQILSNGNDTIAEYGLIWTTNASNQNNLNINNKEGEYIGSTSVGTLPFNYTAIASSLPPDTMVFYRAYVKNSIGYGYGDIKSQKTEEEPVPEPTTRTLDFSIETDSGYEFDGSFDIVNANDINDRETIPITSPVASFQDEIEVDDVDYYIDASGLNLYDSGMGVLIGVYNWNVGAGLSQDQSATLTNNLEIVLLTIQATPTP